MEKSESFYLPKKVNLKLLADPVPYQAKDLGTKT